MPKKIFIYAVDIGTQGDVAAYALHEDGTALASHLCSNRIYARHDMGLTSSKKHQIYYEHAGEFQLVDLVDLTDDELAKHPEFMAAFTLNQQQDEPSN